MSAAPPAADSAARPRRRSFRPQFSLRWLLLAVTAFAIGFPIWYRWPYAEQVRLPNTLGDRQTILWQRQWGGSRMKVGEEFYTKDRLIAKTTYQNEELHGPWTRFNEDGSIRESGEYFQGKDHGQWLDYSRNSQTPFRSSYHRGKPHGAWEAEQSDGTILRLQFDMGRLSAINGSRPQGHLDELLKSGALDSPRMATGLRCNSAMEFTKATTEKLAFYMGDKHGIPIVADPQMTTRSPLLTLSIENIDLATALTIITQHGGLECDYRYGCLWITDADKITNWRDPTGVAQIQRLPGTALHAAWNEPVKVPVAGMLMVDVLQSIAALLAIDIDTSQIEGEFDSKDYFARTIESNTLPFRHVLALLLYRAGYRCELDGQRLVIVATAATQ